MGYYLLKYMHRISNSNNMQTISVPFIDNINRNRYNSSEIQLFAKP